MNRLDYSLKATLIKMKFYLLPKEQSIYDVQILDLVRTLGCPKRKFLTFVATFPLVVKI